MPNPMLVLSIWNSQKAQDEQESRIMHAAVNAWYEGHIHAHVEVGKKVEIEPPRDDFPPPFPAATTRPSGRSSKRRKPRLSRHWTLRLLSPPPWPGKADIEGERTALVAMLSAPATPSTPPDSDRVV
jgi:hypothetical protein